MLLLPVGLDKNEVRRTPWVTFAVMGACLVLHLALSVAESGPSREAGQRLEHVLQYLGERPNLSPPPELGELLGEDGRAELERVAADWRARGGSVSAESAAEEQQQLNRLSEEAFTSLAPALQPAGLTAPPGRTRSPWSRTPSCTPAGCT